MLKDLFRYFIGKNRLAGNEFKQKIGERVKAIG